MSQQPSPISVEQEIANLELRGGRGGCKRDITAMSEKERSKMLASLTEKAESSVEENQEAFLNFLRQHYQKGSGGGDGGMSEEVWIALLDLWLTEH